MGRILDFSLTYECNLKFCSTYGEVAVGQSLALIGSHDFVEISMNHGSASKKFGARVADAVALLKD